MTADFEVDPSDPVFISYRHSDGFQIASELAWLLRSAGIPVWRDVDDLPPGDTRARLKQAIDEGISGAVIIVTPDIVNSDVVREVEAPRLLQLHRNAPGFALGIVTAVSASEKIDYGAPDRLLGLQGTELLGVDQRATDRPGLISMVRQMLWHRIAAIRPELNNGGRPLRLSLQTRNTPQVFDRTDADLDIRLRPSDHEKLPSVAGLRDLADVAHLVPDAVTRSGATAVEVRGGAHLSVALAIGAVIPSTRVGTVTVIDGRGASWASTTEAQVVEPALLRLAHDWSLQAESPQTKRAEVAVYVDLQHPRSDAAFEQFVARQPGLRAWQHWVSNGPGLLDPAAAGTLAAETVARIRELSMTHANALVHLIYRGPFPLAVLVGRLTNTLRFVSYEWDESDAGHSSFVGPRYEPIARVRASTPPGAIEAVFEVNGEVSLPDERGA